MKHPSSPVFRIGSKTEVLKYKTTPKDRVHVFNLQLFLLENLISISVENNFIVSHFSALLDAYVEFKIWENHVVDNSLTPQYFRLIPSKAL